MDESTGPVPENCQSGVWDFIDGDRMGSSAHFIANWYLLGEILRRESE